MNGKNVVSLELSKKLKSCGYPQEGEFWWAKDETPNPIGTKEWILTHIEEGKSSKAEWVTYYSAPLASELMERLPFGIEIGKTSRGFYCCRWDYRLMDEENLCNLLAKMYIYLAEHKLLGERIVK